MRFAITQMSFSPPLCVPMTYEHWMQIVQSFAGCIKARNIQWLYSLVSAQGDRSICLHQVPYTDAIREAYREAGVQFQRVWQAYLWLDREVAKLPQGYPLVIAEVNFEPPITKAIYEESKHQAESYFHELNIQQIFCAASCDGTRLICVFDAANAEDVRSLYCKIGQPVEQVWTGNLIYPHNDIPALAKGFGAAIAS
ncbi:DUF4242 domain-containing protein [Tolypothrix sp. PCC 7910]|uniref:DUF4242 domain-containing protein n=1 Tax=Tolypothrix sp. PCC 7910 TaxID=2099387 RepID=UPI0014278F0A|nr:DUF4242 domain-containing protein [Tolypothrix sp. PCC 7910]QIR37184.1 DUF4242 domain-containing protein [Tolypothrix sp. PCC 7910]